MAQAVLVVDVQNDFVEGGSLGCEGGTQVAADIAGYVSRLDPQIMVVASRDDHEPDSDNGGHTSDQPDYVNTWPPHCIHGTPGQDYVAAFEHSRRDIEVLKGQGKPAYSAFEGQTPDGDSLDHVLRSHGIDELVVCGIATDYCVRASALDAVKLGYAVRLLPELCAAVSGETGAAAIDEMRVAGVQIA